MNIIVASDDNQRGRRLICLRAVSKFLKDRRFSVAKRVLLTFHTTAGTVLLNNYNKTLGKREDSCRN